MVSRGSHCDFRGHERAAVVGPVLPADPESTRARLVSELAALDRLGPPAVRAELRAAYGDLDQLRRDHQDLDRGTGRWVASPAGRAARELDIARQERRTAEHRAELAVGRRERRHWRRVARAAAVAEAHARADWITHTKPVAERLDRRIVMAERRVTDLESHAVFRGRWLGERPELARRIEYVQRELQRLDDPVGAEMLDRLDAIDRSDAPVAGNALEHADIGKVLERLDRLGRARSIEPPGLSL